MSLVGNCVVAQSGGPTSVINASLCGVIQEAIKAGEITGVYGSRSGILGIINDNLVDLAKESAEEIEFLRNTPSSILGSCRYKLKAPGDGEDYDKILNTFKKHNIRYFFYIGGNDSMDTADKLNKFINSSGHEIRIIGVPKTIDNDLYGTDHCPGFGSAAKYIATSMSEIYKDATVYPSDQITIIEIMGRNAGWLTAASAIPALIGQGPDLIYVPEVPFHYDSFKEHVSQIQKQKGDVIICASEGIKDVNGIYVAQNETLAGHDSFGHAQLGGVGNALRSMVSNLGKKIRVVELSLLQRCGAHVASAVDVEEAYQVGATAVRLAISGKSGFMVTINRDSQEPYKSSFGTIPLSEVANKENKIPREWINDEGHGIKQPVFDYILPLIKGKNAYKEDEFGLPRCAKLKMIPVK